MSSKGETATGPLVVVVVLTWNDTQMAARCIESFLASDYKPMRVILVDNGSATPCGEILKQRFPSTELLILSPNRGFTGGSNRGIEKAIEAGADYIHLVGNDATIHPTAVSSLVKALEERPAVGGASPLILYPGEDDVVQFYRARIDRDCALHISMDAGVPLASRSWPTVETEYVPFIGVMFRRRALEEAGLFDEAFGTCWEDYDLCLRFSEAGWSLITVADARLVHLGSATTGKASPYITYHTVRNRLVCLFRYGRWPGMLRNGIFIIRTFYWQVKHYGFGNWACHRAFLTGVLHFGLGIRGEGTARRSTRG